VDLSTFSQQYRLNVKRDVDGTDIVLGKLGHVYEHSDTQLAILFMPSTPRARLWSLTKIKGLASGMVLRQNADGEGTLLFDADNPAQSRLAIGLVRARPKRILTDEQRSRLLERLSVARQSTLKNGTSAARTHEKLDVGALPHFEVAA
jgi:hypothetical protein